MAKHIKQYPISYNENLSYRADLIHAMNTNPDLVPLIKNLCKKDIIYFFNVWAWTHDPRKRPSQRPFLLFQFQQKLVKDICRHIEKGEDLIIEKSRDMGVSFIITTIFLWYWLFQGEGTDFLCGSRSEDLLDKIGSRDSLFEKIRYNLYKMPEQFLPRGFNKLQHDSFMKLINPETKSFITGQSNKYFGTSGRYLAICMDEFAKWENDISSWQASSDASPCRIAISSANGKDNLFYKLRSKEINPDIEVIRVIWSQHPEKTEKWLEQEKKRRSRQDFAAEIMIDYLASIGNRAAENFNIAIHVHKKEYIPQLPIALNCDFNISPMCWCVSQEFKGERYTFKEYYEPNSALTDNLIRKFISDFSRHDNKIITLYGDASGKYSNTKSRQSDWQIIAQLLTMNGWKVIDKVPLKNPPHITRMNITNKRLQDYENNNKSWEFISPECKKLIHSLETTERKDTEIKKNGEEHFYDAWSYQLCREYPIQKPVVTQLRRAVGAY